MRYVKASTASYMDQEEDASCMGFRHHLLQSHDPGTLRFYEDVFEEIEQMALVKFKHGAPPH